VPQKRLRSTSKLTIFHGNSSTYYRRNYTISNGMLTKVVRRGHIPRMMKKPVIRKGPHIGPINLLEKGSIIIFFLFVENGLPKFFFKVRNYITYILEIVAGQFNKIETKI